MGSSVVWWALGPACSGRKPGAQMFALPAGSPKSSCLLIDDNLHNDTECSHAARHERDPASSPVQALAAWPNPYLPACRQQNQQEPEGIWSKDALDNPSGFNTWRGWRVWGDLMLSTCNFTKNSTYKGLEADVTPMYWNVRIGYISIFMFYG